MTQAAFVSQGRAVDYLPVADAPAGTVIVQGNLVGIPANDLVAGRMGALAIEGLFNVCKVAGAISAGAAVYWAAAGNPVGGSAGTGAATTTAGGNSFMGYAVRDADVNDTLVQLTLVKPVSVTVHEDLSYLIADPGNAGAIPVTNSGSVQLVTAGAETRTLAVPQRVGQLLALSMKTDGGDAVVTVAAAVNQAGNNTLTFNDAGDCLVLVGIESGSNKRWRVLSNDGVTLSTV